MTNTNIYPCLWFNNNAHKAAEFYCSAFPGSAILKKSALATTFITGGTKFMALNGGPSFSVNSAISYYVYCGSETEINRLYHLLSTDGDILMPLGKYDWSENYAWIRDRFGVNWQLDVDAINSHQKIVPSLLFANAKSSLVKRALNHYTGIFSNSTVLLEAPYPPHAKQPEGTLLFAQVKLNNFIINAMSSSLPHDADFAEGNSFVIECNDQQEIDYYWNRLTEGGRESMCGWLKDTFGVSWQVVPAVLDSLMSDEKRSGRVMQAFLKMKKFNIKQLLEA
ncbi:MAG: VOC family protein [Flammeovirgaceae bacterium]|nr:MAG: VOC family protein [Flammeovirgaceae bacterium]